MKYIPCDLEANGLLPDVTKIHCLSMNWDGDIRTTNDYDKIRELVQREDITLVGHNFYLYDIPVIEKLLDIKVSCGVIDTLAVSWALYPSRSSHGLESWGEDFGHPKVVVEDHEWENMTYKRAEERCKQDVVIQTELFSKIMTDLDTLYDGDRKTIDKYIAYLSFKMKVVSIQEKNPFKLDVEKCKGYLRELEQLKEAKTEELKRQMPTVGVKSKRTPPAKPYKQDGTLSSTGLKWKKLTEESGLPFEYNEPIEVIKDYDEPNPSSPTQIKDWLFSLGWKPLTFSQGANGKVPQVYLLDKSICSSVIKLGDVVLPLEGLGVLKHRIGLLKGFLRDEDGGNIYQSLAGFTSTLRLRHKFLVNMPKPSVPYGEMIRGALTCDEGYEICGSDLASLEDRTKQHYIYPYDPSYVETMMDDGFDPHLNFAVYAGAMSQEDADFYKEVKARKKSGGYISPDEIERFEYLDKIRHKYKQVNYMATYNVGAKKLAEYLGIKVREAKKMIDDYWKLNWAVKKFASDCETKEALGGTWIKNPLNSYYYQLRSAKDAFSAVNQSTGAYIFDLWLMFVLGKREMITLQSHDEIGLVVKKGNQEEIEHILKSSIKKVNNKLKLNREMDIDIQWGDNYASVH